MCHEFDAPLCRLEGKIVWTVLYLPVPAMEAFGTNNRVNVTATIDGHRFAGVLLPSRNGHYLAFNQEMKAATGKRLGDTVHVTIAEDNAPRTVEVPDEIAAALAAAPGARQAFDALPDCVKREEVRKVVTAKQEATRQRRLAALVDRFRAAPTG